MDLAFLIAMFLVVGLFIYGLRVTAERNYWRDRCDQMQGIPAPGAVLIQYGSDFTQESARQRAERARALLSKVGGSN